MQEERKGIVTNEEISRAVLAYFDDLKNALCPFCKHSIAARVQVGRCVYGESCEHRLYQGRLTAEGKSQ